MAEGARSDAPRTRKTASPALERFESLVDTYKDRLVGYAFRRLADIDNAQDVVQEVFLRVFARHGALADIANAPGYLFRMTANACTQLLRKSKSATVSLDAFNMENIPSGQMDPARFLSAVQELRRIESLFARIPKSQAEVVRLRVLEDLQWADIAETLDCSIDTVKSRFRYGLNKLRPIVLAEWETTMGCRYVRQQLADVFEAGRAGEITADLKEHLAACQKCAREYDEAQKTLIALRPAARIAAPSEFKERTLLKNAAAVEGALFGAEGILHLVHEIEMPPGEKQAERGSRMILRVEPPAEEVAFVTADLRPGESCTITQEIWCEPRMRRWIHLLSLGNRIIYANSWDEDAFRFSFSRVGSEGLIEIHRGFQSEEAKRANKKIRKTMPLAELCAQDVLFLRALTGMHAGFPRLDGDNQSGPIYLLTGEGDETLKDGSSVRVIRTAMLKKDGATVASEYIHKIRKNDGSLAEWEILENGRPNMIERRVLAEIVSAPGVKWDLSDLEGQIGVEEGKPIRMMRAFDLCNSPADLAAKTGFPIYVFSSLPPWVGNPRENTVSPGESRQPIMVSIMGGKAANIIYIARDKRHIVMVEMSPRTIAESENWEDPKGRARLAFETTNRFKVWEDFGDELRGAHALQSASGYTHDALAEDRVSYLLESPKGTFILLATNGCLTMDEFRALVESLVPARIGDEIGER